VQSERGDPSTCGYKVLFKNETGQLTPTGLAESELYDVMAATTCSKESNVDLFLKDQLDNVIRDVFFFRSYIFLFSSITALHWGGAIIVTLRFYHVILVDICPQQRATDAFFCQHMRQSRNLL